MLVHAHRRQSPTHRVALAALERLATGTAPWGIPVFVIGEFVRLVTHPSLFEYPSSISDALAAIDGLLGADGARLLTPGPRYWSVLQDMALDGHATGNYMFDAQIAAVCLERGFTTILTEDRGFRRFTSVRVLRLGDAW